MIPVTQNVQNRQIQRESRLVVAYEEEGMGSDYLICIGFPFGVMI